MVRRRKQFTAEFRAKVALEAIQGMRSVNEIASQFQINPSQVAAWKKKVLDGLPTLLVDGRGHKRPDADGIASQLYEEIGRLKVELDFLKKKSGLHG